MSKRGKIKAGAAIAGATLLFGVTTAGAAAPGTSQGPSTTVDPYVIPVDPSNTTIKSLLTVDNLAADNGYTMAGIPDGLGAYKDGNNVVLLSHHELGAAQGVVRSHGFAGSFISQWTIDPSFKFVAGKDAITTIDWAGTTPSAFARFCSADLAQTPQLFNTVTGKGFNGKLFMSGEETGLEGRAVATDPATGNAWVLPALGRTSWENSVAAYTPTSDTQLVIGLNDSSAANTTANLVYVGTKTNTGSPVDKAGLTNGLLYTMKLTGVTTDAAFRSTYGVGSPQPFTLAQITGATGAALQADSVAKGGFQPDRTEDGVWDPANPNDFYFVTTGSTPAAGGRGGLWRARWNDVTQPSLGGTLTLLVTNPGSHAATDTAANQPGFYMPDNIGIDGKGHLMIQEDPGGDNYLARVYAYDIATNVMKSVATFDPALFGGAGAPGFLTNDEESSGIIDTESIYGAGTFLFDAQVHTATGLSNPTRDAERGQYLLMTVDFAKLFGGPTPVIPEAPVTVLLSLGSLVVIGGYLVLRRRSAGLTAA